MKIAVINEMSAADKNTEILAALEGRGHDIINAGMKKTGAQPELTYIHTGLLGALLLNLKRVDLMIGGCGTGQGFLNSVMQYPGVCCGLIQNPLDSWLFGQINGGNCISLVLNFGYGWSGDINLRSIFDRLFSLEQFGRGYPPHRRESQQQSIRTLNGVSQATHLDFPKIIAALDDSVIKPVLDYSGVLDLLDIDTEEDNQVKRALRSRM